MSTNSLGNRPHNHPTNRPRLPVAAPNQTKQKRLERPKVHPDPGRFRSGPVAGSRKPNPLIHALKDNGKPFCGRPYELKITAWTSSPDTLTCRHCRRGLARHLSVCQDCGRKGRGVVCPTCRAYQKRAGHRRQRPRQLYNWQPTKAELYALHHQYLHQHQSLEEVAKQTPVTAPTLAARFKEHGLPTRPRPGQPGSSRARQKQNQGIRAAKYQQHKHARPNKNYINPKDGRLLQTLEDLLFDGRIHQCTLAYLSQQSGHAAPSVALRRLKKKGYITYKNRYKEDLKLTPRALGRVTRTPAQQRMKESYIPGMDTGDLAWAAGVSGNTAYQYIKAI